VIFWERVPVVSTAARLADSGLKLERRESGDVSEEAFCRKNHRRELAEEPRSVLGSVLGKRQMGNR